MRINIFFHDKKYFFFMKIIRHHREIGIQQTLFRKGKEASSK